MSLFSRSELQRAFGDNPRLIAAFEELDASLSSAADQAQATLKLASEALATAQEAKSEQSQPFSDILTALSQLPYTGAGAIEIVGANQMAIRPVDTDDEASLVTQAFLGPYFASLPDADDDTAAAGVGVEVGGLYRNGSTIMVRIA